MVNNHNCMGSKSNMDEYKVSDKRSDRDSLGMIVHISSQKHML